MGNSKKFSAGVLDFIRQLHFSGKLPAGTRIMNPFRENAGVISIAEKFYTKFYNDHEKRFLVLGINPGRFGGGVTGIPFTDTKRLSSICGIATSSANTHEPSSVFIYDMIEAYGGVKKFYRHFYISSICPLGFVRLNAKKNWVNYNYYDDDRLFKAVKPFMLDCLKKQIDPGIDTDTCFILGRKNAKFISLLNDEGGFFKTLVILDHPRFIEQYKSASREKYIAEYVRQFKLVHS